MEVLTSIFQPPFTGKWANYHLVASAPFPCSVSGCFLKRFSFHPLLCPAFSSELLHCSKGPNPVAQPSTVAGPRNPNRSGGRGRRLAWSQELEQVAWVT